MKSNRHCALILTAASLLPLIARDAAAQERSQIASLAGMWRFAIGDDLARANSGFNDRGWDSIAVPSPWENQGYPGYDGYAWYRKHFTVRPEWREKVLYLTLGTVDDVDEVFVNGEFIGFSGDFPPHYATAYAAAREYPLPQRLLNYAGDNVIAVRVYDQEISGGITSGSVGITQQLDPLHPAASLAGRWKIMTGDDFLWKESGYDDQYWREINVPAFWETEGMKGYDGFAWYRLHFLPPVSLQGKKLTLVLGKIDDLDETFLNGERIGRTGSARRMRDREVGGDEYRDLRAYDIPTDALRFEGDNVIAVRVLDTWRHGGIYDGPVGIVEQSKYAEWRDRQQRERRRPWDVFWDFFR
ncbi:MAG: sugar-binding domain-containing protein [Bacteroidota bacterium]